MRLGCVLLAAGQSRRFHANKLLTEFDQRPLFEWTLDAVPKDMFTQVTVVTSHEQIANASRICGFQYVWNSAPEQGASGSVRLGLQSMQDVDACMFCTCDQPYLSPASLRKLAGEFTGGIRALAFEGERGNPVIFSRQYFRKLEELRGDRGGGVVIRREPDALTISEAECRVELMDIDTEADKKKLGDLRGFFFTGECPEISRKILLQEMKKSRWRPGPAESQNAEWRMLQHPESFDALPAARGVCMTKIQSEVRESPRVVGLLNDFKKEEAERLRRREDMRIVRFEATHEDEGRRALRRFLTQAETGA